MAAVLRLRGKVTNDHLLPDSLVSCDFEHLIFRSAKRQQTTNGTQPPLLLKFRQRGIDLDCFQTPGCLVFQADDVRAKAIAARSLESTTDSLAA